MRGIVTASGGNHGIATARAGFMAGVPTTIFLPTNASPAKIEKLEAWSAAIRIVGSAWHEANDAALAFAGETGAVYFHPFADPAVVAGQGTVGLEILEQMPEVTTVLVAMGGGGLISGVSTALKALAPHVRVVGIEAAGSPVLLRSLEAGHNVALDKVTTSVATMACASTDDRIFDIVRDSVDEIVLVDDDEMLRAAKRLWFEMGLAADLSGAAAIAALAEGRVRVKRGTHLRHRLRRRTGCNSGLERQAECQELAKKQSFAGLFSGIWPGADLEMLPPPAPSAAPRTA